MSKSISKKTLYFKISKILYLKFRGIVLQKQNFNKIICILYYGPYIYHNSFKFIKILPAHI